MSDKRKILLASDDMRMPSGIATMSRELIFGTIHHFDWVQMAGAVNHPDPNVADMSDEANKLTKRNDCYLKVYPVKDYGNEDALFQILAIEKPHAIMHFTDPRWWLWLYAIEHQIRSKIPLTYLDIWDDLPYPMWNKPYYKSCDALFAISKQTDNINKWVLGPENCTSIYGDFDKNGNIIKENI